MKLYSIKCPNCGATVHVESVGTKIYCTYCGSEIYVDDEAQTININKNININKHIKIDKTNREIDEARIEEIQSEERKNRDNNVFFLRFFAIWGIIALGVILAQNFSLDLFKGLFSNAEKVSMPASSAIYAKYSDYHTVVEELELAGFTNVTVAKDEYEGTLGNLFAKNGEVVSVKIGKTDVEAGKEYPADIPIIVYYYYKE